MRQGPGVHCAAALIAGTNLLGTWFDRTAEYQARRRGDNPSPADSASPERAVFTPLPCWAALAPELYRLRVAELVARVVEDGRRERDGRPVLGKKAVLAQQPHELPLHSDRSPAPLVHAATREIRIMLRAAYWEFVVAFREAAYRLRRGDRLVRFPLGAFPPPLPCVSPTS